MAVMSRAQFAKQLQEGLNTVWGLEYNSHPEEYKQIFKIEKSIKSYEEDVLTTGFGAAVVKPEGTAVSYDDAAEAWTSRYVHDTIALGFQISQECLEDNLYMTMGAKYSKALARSMAHAIEIKAAAILNNGYSSSYTGGDGVALFSASHPLAGGGTFSNILGTPADFSETALEDILIQIRKCKDDRGIPIALKATDIIIPPELEYIASRILNSAQRPGTPDNDLNAVKHKGIFGRDPVIVTRLTDGDFWTVKTDAADGLKMFVRVPVQTKMEPEFNTGSMRFAARTRFSFGWSDPRSCFGSQGS